MLAYAVKQVEEITHRFVVFTNYGIEGWKISGQAMELEDAIKIREMHRNLGNAQIEVFEHWQIAYVPEQEAYPLDEVAFYPTNIEGYQLFACSTCGKTFKDDKQVCSHIS